MKAIVLVEHIHIDGSSTPSFIYETPCKTLTYNDNRKKHSWVLIKPFGIITYHEDYARACKEAKENDKLVLLLDGVPTNKGA